MDDEEERCWWTGESVYEGRATVDGALTYGGAVSQELQNEVTDKE